MLRTLFVGLLLLSLVACSNNAAEDTPVDPIDLVTTASENIRETESFRMEVERTGASYFVETDLGLVDFRRAVAQYVAPNMLQATVRLIAAGLPADVDIFSRGDEQWYRHAVLTANRWFNAPFAEGFNPESLIAEDTGFQMALNSLIDLSFVGREELEDGTAVYHIAGIADGADISALLANLVVASGEVLVDVFIDRNTLLPSRFIIVQPDTVTDEDPDPTTWTVDVYDINSEPEIEIPG